MRYAYDFPSPRRHQVITSLDRCFCFETSRLLMTIASYSSTWMRVVAILPLDGLGVARLEAQATRSIAGAVMDPSALKIRF